MDAVITTILGAGPQLTVAGALIVVISLLIRREGQANASQQKALDAAHARHASELSRINQAHDDELTELRTEIRGLREQTRDLHDRLDAERVRRRTAEDAVAARQSNRPGDAG